MNKATCQQPPSISLLFTFTRASSHSSSPYAFSYKQNSIKIQHHDKGIRLPDLQHMQIKGNNYKRSEKHASVQQDKTCSCNGYYTLEIQEALPEIWLDLIRELNVKPALFEKNGIGFTMPPT